jgi:hypothetical protein
MEVCTFRLKLAQVSTFVYILSVNFLGISRVDLHDVFRVLVACHILTGAVGLVYFWGPIASRKGSEWHRKSGRVFNRCMLWTGAFAVLISACTIADPLGTHPHLVGHPEFSRPEFVRAIFGWMMLGFAVLTVNLAWHGWLCVLHKRDREKVREWRNLWLQAALLLVSVNCAWQAWHAGVFLMFGMTFIGIATVATNLFFLYRPNPGGLDWLKEHVKALVGAGISVYTAFFAFGAVRTFPELALHPGLWAVPLAVGLTLIIVHHRRIDRQRANIAASSAAA